jgi:hypothetical protein
MIRSLAAKAVELRRKNGEDLDLADKEGVYDEWKGVKVGKQVLMSVAKSTLLSSLRARTVSLSISPRAS